MNIKKEIFGTLKDGGEVTRYVLENKNGLAIAAMDYGANLLSVRLPDRSGSVGEVTLGFDTLARYEGDHPYFGATIGRYANRISGAKFTLGGKHYELYADADGMHLHGGEKGFDKRMWDSTVEADGNQGKIQFHRISPDGEENYPGNIDVSVSFILTEQNELSFVYDAVTDAATPINLTNHTYWNLAGPGCNIEKHLLEIKAEQYLAIDDALIPTGELLQTKETAFDFTSQKAIGKDIDAAGGYDHCFVINGDSGMIRPAAVVHDPVSGRGMTIETTQPAVQFYTSNMMDKMRGRGDIEFDVRGALCLETGGYNNAVNIPEFPCSILEPGSRYQHMTRHTFWIE